MKFFAFTDLHADLKTLRKIVTRVNKDDIDIVVSCGDLSHFGMGLEDAFELLGQIKKTVLLIPGNEHHESSEDVDHFCKIYKNCININHQDYVYKDHIFVGYGDGGFGHTDHKLKFLSKKFKSYFDSHEGKKVLVLHGPPHGTTCDDKSAWYPDGSGYYGSKTATNLILDTQIDLVLCGHLHECEDCMDKIGKSVILNPSSKGKVITIE